jgi:hypothetical protein
MLLECTADVKAGMESPAIRRKMDDDENKARRESFENNTTSFSTQGCLFFWLFLLPVFIMVVPSATLKIFRKNTTASSPTRTSRRSKLFGNKTFSWASWAMQWTG